MKISTITIVSSFELKFLKRVSSKHLIVILFGFILVFENANKKVCNQVVDMKTTGNFIVRKGMINKHIS